MTNRTPNLSDYTLTDLVIWEPRYPHDGDSAPIGGSYPMDCFEPASNRDEANEANEAGTLYLRVPYCSGGDYCGGAVELANYHEFVDMFGNRTGVVKTTGYPGGFGIVVKLSTLDNDDEMIEVVNGLYNYPCIDDECLDEVEQEIIEDSISYFHDDALKYLVARYNDNATVAGMVEDAFDAIDYRVLMRELEIIGDGIGVYWEVETCTSAYFNIEKVIDSMSNEAVATLLGITSDDLLPGPNLPPTDDLAQLVSAVIAENMVPFELAQEWHEEHENDDDYDEDDTPEYGYSYIDLTVGIDTEGDDENTWGYQTGDNCYTGGAYGHPDWAVVCLSAGSDPAEVVAEIRSELSELFYAR